jgi:hypothetical protein
MAEVQCLATALLAAFVSMPLLTELISREDGSYYRHDAPNGAVFPSQHPIALKATESLNGLLLVYAGRTGGRDRYVRGGAAEAGSSGVPGICRGYRARRQTWIWGQNSKRCGLTLPGSQCAGRSH